MPDKVLIVDDDAAVLGLLEKVIRSNSLLAECAESAEKALDLLARHTYDLILMDVNMRGMDGFTAVETIRSRGVKTPIIIVSGRKEDFDTLYGLDIGADDYITKPFNPVTLGAKVKALIRRRRNSLAEAEPLIAAGPFTYNTSTLRLYKNGVALTDGPTWTVDMTKAQFYGSGQKALYVPFDQMDAVKAALAANAGYGIGMMMASTQTNVAGTENMISGLWGDNFSCNAMVGNRNCRAQRFCRGLHHYDVFNAKDKEGQSHRCPQKREFIV